MPANNQLAQFCKEGSQVFPYQLIEPLKVYRTMPVITLISYIAACIGLFFAALFSFMILLVVDLDDYFNVYFEIILSVTAISLVTLSFIAFLYEHTRIKLYDQVLFFERCIYMGKKTFVWKRYMIRWSDIKTFTPANGKLKYKGGRFWETVTISWKLEGGDELAERIRENLYRNGHSKAVLEFRDA